MQSVKNNYSRRDKKFDQAEKWLMHKPESVLENDMHKSLRYSEIQIDYSENFSEFFKSKTKSYDEISSYNNCVKHHLFS